MRLIAIILILPMLFAARAAAQQQPSLRLAQTIALPRVDVAPCRGGARAG